MKYSLTNLTDCKHSADKFLPPINVSATVLHLNRRAKRQVHTCRLTYSKRIHFCEDTFYRHYGSKIIALEKPVTLSAKECWHIINTGIAKFEFEEERFEFQTASTGITPYVIFNRGGLDDEVNTYILLIVAPMKESHHILDDLISKHHFHIKTAL